MATQTVTDFPDFLPPAIAAIGDPDAIALAQQIQRQGLTVPLPEPVGSQTIATSFVAAGPDSGDRAPLLLIHGFDSSLLEYRRLIPPLAERHRLYAIDLLGFGFTDRPAPVAYTAAAVKAHLHRFWETVLQRPAIVVGASMGGAVALDFAATYPDAVERVILLDSAGFVGKPLASRFLIEPLGKLATNFLANPKVRNGIGRNAYCDPDTWATIDAYRCGALHLGMDRWSEALISFTRNGGYTIAADRIAQVQQPTLILWGDRDRILGTAPAQRFAATLPHNQLQWVPQCGHVPHLEQAEFTAISINEFLTTP